MIPNDFTVAIAEWANEDDRNACKDVREKVYIAEQKVREEDEWDEFDERSRHVLARDAQGNPIGTGRLTPNMMIGRMAVLREWRGREVGTMLLHTLLEQARALHYPAIELHAQTQAAPFYERFGFARYGDEFDECGIPHVNMRLELSPLAPPERASPPPRPEARIVPIESREQALAETLGLIAAARREVYIYTRDLDPLLFDTEEVLDALKRVAISGRGAAIRVLIQDPQQPIRHGHRLIKLAQRLTSVFTLRTPTQAEDLQYASAFVLNDSHGFYFRTLGTRFDGEVVTYAPGRHAQLLEYFRQVWERSETSEELRQLAI
ncbi:MAG TPA: GNAT family N-acetyltransferase [Rudaea sp.]|nr:GNAT family N-acetyltransferase [Rudaea sp.]